MIEWCLYCDRPLNEMSAEELVECPNFPSDCCCDSCSWYFEEFDAKANNGRLVASEIERNKFYAVQKMYCRLYSRSDGWIHCQDCRNFANCELRVELKQDSFEYCEEFVRKKDN